MITRFNETHFDAGRMGRVVQLECDNCHAGGRESGVAVSDKAYVMAQAHTA